MNKKPIIYQLLPRLFANKNSNCVPNGTYAQNGAGKMNDITLHVLKSIKDLGVTHIWYTGIIELDGFHEAHFLFMCILLFCSIISDYFFYCKRCSVLSFHRNL